MTRAALWLAAVFVLAPACAEGKLAIDEPSVEAESQEYDDAGEPAGCNPTPVVLAPELAPCGAAPAASPDPCAAGACDARGVLLRRGGHPKAFAIVFVPVGFDDEDLPEYRRQTARMTGRLLDHHNGIVGRRPELFDFHRVDRVAPALTACLRPEDHAIAADRRRESLIEVDLPRLRGLGRAAVPTATTVVGVVHAKSGRASASFPGELASTVVVRAHDDTSVLEHELGHAVAGLGDEYVGSNDCSPGAAQSTFAAKFETEPPPPYPPNLSACLSHGPDSCRMLDHNAPDYCPVCNAEIARVLAHRSGDLVEPPRCVLRLDQPPNSVSDALMIELVATSLDPPLSATLRVLDSEGEPAGGEHASRVNGPHLLMRNEPRDLPSSGRIVATCRDGVGRESVAAVEFAR